MREFWILTKLQVSSLFGINKILHMKNQEEKKQGKRALGSLVAMVFAMGYMSVLYSYMLARSFKMFNTLPTLLGVMALAAAMAGKMYLSERDEFTAFRAEAKTLGEAAEREKVAIETERKANLEKVKEYERNISYWSRWTTWLLLKGNSFKLSRI